MYIALSRVHFPTTNLGPGNRIGIWFQGCSLGCRGCISRDTWPQGKNKIPLTHLHNLLKMWLPVSKGITITGGEPFEQPDSLLDLLRFIKSETSNTVLIFSGYSLEYLKKEHLPVLQYVDALISDPYLDNFSSKKPLRGSDNQRLTFFSPKGAEEFKKYNCKSTRKESHINFMIEKNSAWMTGIPNPNFLDDLKRTLKENGHEVAID